MIITEIGVGLGNQLFQYAHAKAWAVRLNQPLYLDVGLLKEEDKNHFSELNKLKYFKTSFDIATETAIAAIKRRRIKYPLLRKTHTALFSSPYLNTKCHFDQNLFDKGVAVEKMKQCTDIYISGYFGDISYFQEIQDVLRKEFVLRFPFNTANLKVLSEIEQATSISLHFRRGDYVGSPFFAEIPLSYYAEAISYFSARYPDAAFFVFSDDLVWVKQNFRSKANLRFVDVNDGSTDYMDMMLMASCKHNVIANSTFSWWGAWLNNNPNKIVFAPDKWYINQEAQEKYQNGRLVLSTWIKL